MHPTPIVQRLYWAFPTLALRPPPGYDEPTPSFLVAQGRIAEFWMSVSYTCPNPDCGVTLKTPSRVAAGKSVKCPKCNRPFVPEPGEEAEAGEAGPGTYGLADAPVPKKPAP